jgi:hypothetical protein
MPDWIPRHTERQIVEDLDGRLDPADQADLARRRMRDPQVRQVYQQYQENDRRAAAALKDVLGGHRPVENLPGHRRKGLEWSALVSSGWAAAAAIALAAGAWMVFEQISPTTELAQPRMGVGGTVGGGATRADGSAATGQRPELQGPAEILQGRPTALADGRLVDRADQPTMTEKADRGDRRTTRSFLGVFDEQGDRFLYLEMDRSRTRILSTEEEL